MEAWRSRVGQGCNALPGHPVAVLEALTTFLLLIAISLQIAAARRAKILNGRIGRCVFWALVLMIGRRVTSLALSWAHVELTGMTAVVVRFLDAGVLPLAISVLIFAGLNRFGEAWHTAKTHAAEVEASNAELHATLLAAQEARSQFDQATAKVRKLCSDNG